MDYQLSATRALLQHAARNRTYWLRNFLDVQRRAVGRTHPHAFVIPAQQKDPLATAKLLEVLHLGGVELHSARQPFTAAGRRFEAGTVVVRLAQPAGAFAKTVLERQDYPDLRQYPGGPPLRPYDVTAHTLPLLLGVEVARVEEPFTASLAPLATTTVAPGRVTGRGAFLALSHKNGEMVGLGRLLRARVPVRWATEAFTDHGRTFAAGTLLVPASARRQVEALARELGLTVQAVGAAPPSALRLARAPR
ncbi:MAG: M14 family zinc carboxypeptidase, partial [bacterium]